jgi:hypothetical protein
VGSTFTGWSGGGCTGLGTCTVTVTAPTTVTATFVIVDVTLTVVKAGSGSGTVTSSPLGINCGTDCADTCPLRHDHHAHRGGGRRLDLRWLVGWRL